MCGAHRLRDPRRDLLLVSENERPNDVGAHRQMDVLADDHWLQSNVHDPTRAWLGRNAAADLYLSGSARLGLDEHGLYHRRLFHDSRVHSFRVGFGEKPGPRKTCRPQSVECMDARMGNDFAATA